MVRRRFRADRLLSAAAILLLLFVVLATAWGAIRDLRTSGQTGGLPTVEALAAAPGELVLPNRLGSLKFAVMGDVGRGDHAQYETADQLARWRERFAFDLVLLLGDNNYGAGTPEEYAARFERPYAALLDNGVEFQAVLGNHDPADSIDYPPYGMRGRRYYTFARTSGLLAPERVQFFALDTVTLDRTQLDWLRRELGRSSADWTIAFYHHPLYTSGRYAGSGVRLRRLLEPIFVRHGVDVGLNGHEHVYERITLQRGVQYFTSGAGGALRIDDLRETPLTAAGYDDDTHFVLMEVAGDDLWFQAITRRGVTVDAGRVTRGAAAPPASLRR